MDPKLVAVESKEQRKDRALRPRELRRIIALTWSYRKTLAVGLLVTVLFASLHTLSLVGVYPVFQILLEREGLSSYVNRTLASERLGVEFAPPDDSAILRVQKIDQDSPVELQTFDVVADPENRTVAVLLHDLAHAEDGATVEILAGPTRETVEPLTVSPGALDRKMRLLQWGGSFIPADSDTDSGKLRLLVGILVGLVVMVLISNVFRYVGEVMIARAILRTLMGLRARLYERTLHLPMSFFAGQPTADLVTRFVQDIQEIQRGLLTLFGKFIREPLRAAFILSAALFFDWRITLAMVAVAPIALAIFLLVGRSVKKANRKLLEAYGMMIGALTTSLQSLRVVKAYTAEDHERDRLRAVDWRMFRQQLKLAKLQAFVSPMMESLGVMAGSLVTVWLASRVLSRELDLAHFTTLGFILANLLDPLRKLTDVYVRVQRSTAGAERIFQVLDQPVESDLSSSATELQPLQRSIEFSDVTFTYPGADEPALRNVNLSIAQGETVAIVGPNGCGKTTLVSMLPRFFSPDSGVVTYDGLDLREATLRSLRMQISLVSQEAIIFAGTPVENIAFGVPEVDRKRAEEAAVRAFADEFIRAIPGGYEAALGERGSTLSGGQRQRLVIARAIYRNAPILIFDEATSQIDSESERKIQAAVSDFSQGRTTLVIAHRLSTIQHADRIIVMDGGRVIDGGRHRELFERCSLYRTLCQTQFVDEPAPE